MNKLYAFVITGVDKRSNSFDLLIRTITDSKNKAISNCLYTASKYLQDIGGLNYNTKLNKDFVSIEQIVFKSNDPNTDILNAMRKNKNILLLEKEDGIIHPYTYDAFTKHLRDLNDSQQAEINDYYKDKYCKIIKGHLDKNNTSFFTDRIPNTEELERIFNKEYSPEDIYELLLKYGTAYEDGLNIPMNKVPVQALIDKALKKDYTLEYSQKIRNTYNSFYIYSDRMGNKYLTFEYVKDFNPDEVTTQSYLPYKREKISGDEYLSHMLFPDKVNSVLTLGLGLGSVSRYYKYHNPRMKTDYIEIFNDIIRIAKVMNPDIDEVYEGDCVMAFYDENVNIPNYDQIIVDSFLPGAYTLNSGIVDIDYLKLLYDKCNVVLSINSALGYEDKLREYCDKICAKVMSHVIGGNVVYNLFKNEYID